MDAPAPVYTGPVDLDDLALMYRYRPGVDPWPSRESLFADLDANGMREPLLAYKAPWLVWLKRCRTMVGIPHTWTPRQHDGSVWLVKRGNQRVAWARMRGLTSLPVLLFDDEGACDRFWQHRQRLGENPPQLLPAPTIVPRALSHIVGIRVGDRYDEADERAWVSGIHRTTTRTHTVRVIREDEDLDGWWVKFRLFDPAMDLPRVVYFFDMDLVFRRDLDAVLDALDAIPHPVAAMWDWFVPGEFGSAVMRIDRESDVALRVWDRFQAERHMLTGGDQGHIGRFLGDEWGAIPDRLLCSYKTTIGRFPKNADRDHGKVDEVSILGFHGRPRPAEVAAHAGWPHHAMLREYYEGKGESDAQA
jgi:hypothetical protein